MLSVALPLASLVSLALAARMDYSAEVGKKETSKWYRLAESDSPHSSQGSPYACRPSHAAASPWLTTVVAAQTDSVTPTSGNYLIQNVATGQYLYFARDGQVGAYLGDNQSGMNLESATFEGVSGVIIKGTDSSTLKCLASQ